MSTPAYSPRRPSRSLVALRGTFIAQTMSVAMVISEKCLPGYIYISDTDIGKA